MSSTEDAQQAARAHAYLESDPEIMAAIRRSKAWSALLLMVSADVRDHYTAKIVQAIRSVTDARVERSAVAELLAAHFDRTEGISDDSVESAEEIVEVLVNAGVLR